MIQRTSQRLLYPILLQIFFSPQIVFSKTAFENGITEKEVLIGVVNGIEGKNKSGIEINAGLNAALNEVNKKNSCGERKIRAIFYDDQYEPKNTLNLTKKLTEEDKVFLLMGYNGTPTLKAAFPFLIKSGIPFLFPRTGDEFARENLLKNIFNLRPSFAQEMATSVKSVIAQGHTKFALMRQDDAFGDALKFGLVSALKASGDSNLTQSIVGEGKILRNDQNPTQAFNEIAAVNPDIVVIGSAPQGAANFIQLADKNKKKWIFLGVSMSAGVVSLLNEANANVVITQFVPDFEKENLAIAQQFRSAMNAVGLNKDKSIVSFESYLSMRIACEAIKRSGPSLSREKFLSTLQGEYELGGFSASWSKSNHNNPAKIYMSKFKNKRIVYD